MTRFDGAVSAPLSRTLVESGAAERRRAVGARAVMFSARYRCIDLQLARGPEKGPEPAASCGFDILWRCK